MEEKDADCSASQQRVVAQAPQCSKYEGLYLHLQAALVHCSQAGLMAGGDDKNDALPTRTGCVLEICLSEVDVRLLMEKPWATTVKKKAVQ